MGKALDGIRILDMTHVQSGPTCTQILAWFGADVIKVELPGRGDITRGQLRDKPNVDSLYFTMLNCNKRSITINTKHEKGKEVFRKLIKVCDVMVENFAPGALDRQGFTWEVIHETQSAFDLRVGQGVRPRSLRRLQSLRERRPVHRRRGEHDRIRRRPAAGDRRADRRLRHRHSSRRGNSWRRFFNGKRPAGTASHLRHAGYGAQSLPGQAARSATTRRRTADGISAISQRRLSAMPCRARATHRAAASRAGRCAPKAADPTIIFTSSFSRRVGSR